MTLQSFKIHIHQRRIGKTFHWTTVGLGKAGRTVTGRSEVKVQRKLGEELSKSIRKLPAAELSRFQVVPGAALRQVYIDVNMRLASGKQRLSGEVPLICQPRQTNAEQSTLVVFHPLHQDHWFFCNSDAELTTLATRFFRHALGHLSQEQVNSLKKTGKEMLRSFSFSADVPTLLERIPKPEGRHQQKRQAQPVLGRIGADQTLRAIEGTLPIGMPRAGIREQLNQLCGGARRQSVMVVGEPGAGKSTAIRRWVADDLEHSGFKLHRDLSRVESVWRVSGKRIIAGMSYLGDWEQRCLDLLAECKKKRALLWLDDIHAFGRLGQTRNSDRNLAEVFRGPVSRGELTMIGECTPSQRQRLEDDAPAFASLFRIVRLPATTNSETTLMMLAEARALEHEYRVRFDAFVYQSILELGGGLYPWTAFPGKALDLLRRLARGATRGDQVSSSDLVNMLAADSGLPGNLLTLEEPIDLEELRASIAAAVIGQPVAVATAVDLVARVRSGLSPSGRPLAVYLFTGPTGTGKTELAKVLARYLYGGISRLIRFDMSEYTTADSAARLIGDLYEPEGQLTGKIRAQPFSIVLFDEIEKAHQSVLYLLLQLFDEGRLTDAAGTTASFANAVVVMTSNLGAKPTQPIGFGSETRGMMADISRAVRDFFPPELFNRIDAVVPFNPLSPRAAESIATKEMAELFARRGLVERNVFVYASSAVKKRIVRDAFDPRLGARTVKRYLEHEIGGLLVDELTKGGRPRLQVLRLFETQASEMSVHSEALAEAEPTAAKFALLDAFEANAKLLVPLAKQAAALVRDQLTRTVVDKVAFELKDSSLHAELAFFIDELKERRERLLGELESAAPTTALMRTALVGSIANAHHLTRNLPSLEYPEAHAVWIDLSCVGWGRAGQTDASPNKLIGWLAKAYARARDGWFDGFAVTTSRGMRTGKTLDELEKALAGGTRRISLLLSGLFAVDTFAGEPGSHIWQPSSAEPEMVRVDVTSAGIGEIDPGARLSAISTGVKAFETALSIGQTPLPPNPEGLVPAVRSLRFNLPLRSTEVFKVNVLDFRTQASLEVHVTSVTKLIGTMIDCWCGREVLR